MNYLIYISTSVKLFDDNDLKEMLLQSRRKNEAVGITGVLLYNKGTFFQVLEGEEEQVNTTYEMIKNDPRHKNIIKMKSGTITERNFPDWSMGFTTTRPSRFSHLPGFVDPLKQDFLQNYNTNHPAVNLLRSFTSANNFVF
jgi:hypothetical protein